VAGCAIPSGCGGSHWANPRPPMAVVAFCRSKAADFPAGRIRTLYEVGCMASMGWPIVCRAA
jgi:hypothetical protein